MLQELCAQLGILDGRAQAQLQGRQAVTFLENYSLKQLCILDWRAQAQQHKQADSYI